MMRIGYETVTLDLSAIAQVDSLFDYVTVHLA